MDAFGALELIVRVKLRQNGYTSNSQNDDLFCKSKSHQVILPPIMHRLHRPVLRIQLGESRILSLEIPDFDTGQLPNVWRVRG